MSHLEPNALALLWFIPLWSICCLGFLHLSGMFPIKDAASTASVLVVSNAALFAVLVVGTLVLASHELRWSTIVVVGSILLLFIPEAFQALPVRWQDGRPGTVAASFMLAFAVAVLFCVADPARLLLS
jgi:hypothetical protein